MKAEQQHQEPQSRTIQTSKDSNGLLSFVDNRPESVAQAKMIAAIQRAGAEDDEELQMKPVAQLQSEDLKTSTAIIQRNPVTSRRLRSIANYIANNVAAIFTKRTVGVSNNMFAITPKLEGKTQQQDAVKYSGSRDYAGPRGDVLQGDQDGNHAEKKLICYDKRIQEIGVDRDICQSCVNAICAKAGTIKHVSQSDPDVTYAVTTDKLVPLTNP